MEDRSTSEIRSLVVFLLGVAGLIVILTLLGGWALPVVIGSIFVIVMLHEFGHYITAKRAGMKVTDFFVGFGPVIWSTTRSETRYGVRALLFGGYVKVPGMTWGDSLPPKKSEGPIVRRRTHARCFSPRRDP